MHHGIHKAPGGLVRAATTVAGSIIADVELTGDVTCVPRAAFASIAEALVGCRFDTGAVIEVVEATFAGSDLQCPGVSPADIASAVTGPARLGS